MKTNRFKNCFKRANGMCLATVLTACLFSTWSSVAYAEPSPTLSGQQQKANHVTGQVVDSSKEPLIGVSVAIVGSDGVAKPATITDFDGMFTVEIDGKSATLEFTYIGFKSKQVKVSPNTLVNVALEEDAGELEEVVITGYGSQKKASIIGAIETVQPDELKFGTTRTLSNNLAGKISGVIGIQRSGEPGYDDSNFWIRGISSFSNQNKPLVLIDGVERDLDNVDVAEIESFSVLKDASASAMYGVRGANGVIVITTKHGQIGPPSVKFHLEHSINSPTKYPEFLNAADYMTLLNQLADQDGKTIPFSEERIHNTRIGYDPDLYPDVNWVDAVTKDYAYSTRGNVDISGGADFLRYSIVASYFKETGMLEQDHTLPINNATNNQQFNLRSNIDMNVTKTTLLRVNIGGYLNRFKKQNCNTDDVFNKAFYTLPFVHPIRYSDGAIPVESNRANPWLDATQHGYEFMTSSKLQTLFSVEQDLRQITSGLKARAIFSFDRWNKSNRKRTANPATVFPATKRDELGNIIYRQNGTGDESMGAESGGEYGNSRIYFEAGLMYNRRFGKHDVDGLFLYNQQAYDDGSYQDYRKQGIAGRFSYTYDNRYVAEFNFGYNGSENFAKGHRFGFFPSAAIGWLMSEEPWMQSVHDIFHKIKFRISAGQAGDDNIGGRRFAYLGTLYQGQEGYSWGTTGQRSYSGITEGQIAVADLTWETVTKYNAGVELGLFNAVDFNIDFFREIRTNIFMQRSIIPTQTGFVETPWANFGKVTNGGIEMTLNLHKQWNKNLFTSAYGNFTFAKNRVDERDEAAVKKGTYRGMTGRSLNELWGLQAERLFTAKDFDENGDLLFGIPDQSGVGATKLHPGDIKYIDMNGDGLITEEDEGYIGGTEDPRVVFGFGGVIAYKNFDFNFFFQGTADTYRVIGNSTIFLPGSGTTVEGNAYSANLDDRWIDGVNEDPYAFWPRLTYGPNKNNYRASTWWKKNMGFTRLKTVEIGYTIPKKWAQTCYMKSARVFVSGNNLLCFSAFKLWDPELGTNNGLRYPMNKSIMFGVDVNF